MGDLGAPAVAELVSTVAREVEPRLGALTSEMVGIFMENIPALRTDDDDVRELLAASSSSNVATALDMFSHGIPVDQIDVPAAAAHYARRLAQRDVPVEALLRAYRLGEALFIQYWLGALEQHTTDAELLLAATKYTTAVASRYIDQISENLIEIYEEERKLWAQRAAATRAVQVRTVLIDEELDATTAEALTGYRMHGTHVGLVAWSTSTDGGREVETAVQAIAEASGAQPLAVLADDRTLWAWISGPRATAMSARALEAAVARRGGTIRIAVGNAGVGLQGFRSSHREAQSAQRVAVIRGDDGGDLVTVFTEVAVSAFLARDLRAARRWVSEVLGGLAVDDPSMTELRRTVLSFLQTGASLTEAATMLHLHKNTVRYRLRKAEDVRGRPLNERRMDVEVALLACEHLGRGVLIRTGL